MICHNTMFPDIILRVFRPILKDSGLSWKTIALSQLFTASSPLSYYNIIYLGVNKHLSPAPYIAAAPLECRIQFKVSVFIFKVLNTLGPGHLKD